MAGGIWGEGQRGGIFGARVDPALLRELEQRAEAKRRMAQGLESAAPQEPTDTRPTFEQSLAGRILAAPSKLFGGLIVDPAVEGITDLLTLAGDVKRGEQPTMSADPQTGEMHTDPRLSERTANAAGTLTLGAGAIPAEANALRMGIKAYHGSPHDFERFDASKIGTGEGAQAYGHGLYFAEREGVAKDYRRKLASGADTPQFSENVPQNVRDAIMEMHKHLRSSKNYSDYSPGEILDAFKRGDWSNASKDVNEAIKQGIASGDISMKPAGKMYEVDIAAEPEQFLDWDKPLSEQSPQVREALGWREPEQIAALQKELADIDSRTEAIMSSSHLPDPDKDVDAFWKAMFADTPENREYNDLINRKGELRKDLRIAQEHLKGKLANENMTGEAYLRGGFNLSQRHTANDPEKARQLREAGIPGIRYLDQGSRGPATIYNVGSPRADFGPYSPYTNRADAEEQLKLLRRMGETDAEIKEQIQPQSRNYVIFPGSEHLISVLKKYGLPISAAGLAALTQLHPEEAKAAQQKDRK